MEFSDSDIIFITLIGTFLFGLLVAFVFAAIYLNKRRQMEYVNEQIRREQEFSEEMLRTQLELTEKIMSSISEEIHDNVGQLLTVAKLSLNAMTDTDYQIHADNAKDLITRSLADLRNLSKALNGDYILREGIQKAIERELKLISQSGEIECMQEGEFNSEKLSPDREIVLYRCIQEAISNTLKHAQAKTIRVKTGYVSGSIEVEVNDDGIGFDTSEANGKGVGMSSMKKRIELMGGTLKVVSQPNAGTQIRIAIPTREK